jgi:hypothetical protein
LKLKFEVVYFELVKPHMYLTKWFKKMLQLSEYSNIHHLQLNIFVL